MCKSQYPKHAGNPQAFKSHNLLKLQKTTAIGLLSVRDQWLLSSMLYYSTLFHSSHLKFLLHLTFFLNQIKQADVVTGLQDRF